MWHVDWLIGWHSPCLFNSNIMAIVFPFNYCFETKLSSTHHTAYRTHLMLYTGLLELNQLILYDYIFRNSLEIKKSVFDDSWDILFGLPTQSSTESNTYFKDLLLRVLQSRLLISNNVFNYWVKLAPPPFLNNVTSD